MRRTLLLTIAMALVALPGAAINENAGTTGFSFLKIGVGARPAAMGGACAALSAHADAPAANPAGLYGLAARTGTLALSSYLMDTQAGYLSIALPRGGRAMALSAVYVTYGDMRRTNETGQDLGSFTASDVAALATVAQPVWRDRLVAGASLKAVYSAIDSYSSDAYMVDLGLLFHTPVEGLALGASLSNLGTVRHAYAGGLDDSLPVMIRLGLAHRPAHMPVPVLLIADLNAPNDGDPYLAVGAEARLPGGLYVRPGYSAQQSGLQGDQAVGLCGGIGLTARNLRLDYAYASYPDLGDVHRLAVAGSF